MAQITIYFGHKQKLDLNEIQVIKKNVNWNDFSHEIIYNYRFIGENHFIIEDVFYLGFFDKATTFTSFSETNKVYVVDVENIKEKPPFFSMQTNMQSYRNIVGKLGIDDAKNLLLAMNDVVALHFYPNKPFWADEAISMDVFKLAFLRRSETFFTFYNAGSILSGLKEENIKGISQNIFFEFKLDGFKNNHSLKFGFDHHSILPKRICILIGKNGTGKSQTLYQLISTFLTQTSSKNILEDPQRIRPLINRIIAIGTPGETSNSFPRERRYGNIIYHRLIITRGNTTAYNGMGDILVQLARSEESIKNISRWNLFVRSIEKILPVEKIFIPIDNKPSVASSCIIHNGKCYVSINDFYRNKGEQATLEIWGSVPKNAEPLISYNEKDFYPLSSGQLSFFKVALLACLYIENGTLVVLDEPETHLHPNLIGDFIDLLDYLLESTGSQSIIATHSTYFVREVPRDQVHVFSIKDDNIYISNPRLKTFGADVGAISYFIFEDETNERLLERILMRIERKNRDKSEMLNSIKSELSTEAIMALNRKLKIGPE